MLNLVRTYQKHGFPEDALRRRDVVIIAIPALLIGYATLEAIEIMDTKSAETEIMGE